MIESWLRLACAVAGARQANAPPAASDFRNIGFTLLSALEFAPHVEPPIAARPAHREAGPRGRGGALAQAHGAGRSRAPGRRRAVVVAPGGLAGAPARRADRPRGDGRDRLPGEAHAVDKTGGRLEALCALR